MLNCVQNSITCDNKTEFVYTVNTWNIYFLVFQHFSLSSYPKSFVLHGGSYVLNIINDVFLTSILQNKILDRANRGFRLVRNSIELGADYQIFEFFPLTILEILELKSPAIFEIPIRIHFLLFKTFSKFFHLLSLLLCTF